jgi:hypothetical protein
VVDLVKGQIALQVLRQINTSLSESYEMLIDDIGVQKSLSVTGDHKVQETLEDIDVVH